MKFGLFQFTYMLSTFQQFSTFLVTKDRVPLVTATYLSFFVISFTSFDDLFMARRTRIALVTNSRTNMATRERQSTRTYASRTISGMAKMVLNFVMMTMGWFCTELLTRRIQ